MSKRCSQNCAACRRSARPRSRILSSSWRLKERACALDRLLKLAPALEAAGAEPMSEEEIVAEVKAVRAERRAKLAASMNQDPSADRA